MWDPVAGGANDKWIKNNKLIIDPIREQYLDLAKQLTDKGYVKNNVKNTKYSSPWQDLWFADMKATSGKQVFGYFGPAWIIFGKNKLKNALKEI